MSKHQLIAKSMASELMTNADGLRADRLALKMDENDAELGGYGERELAEKLAKMLGWIFPGDWHPADPPGMRDLLR